MGSVGQGLGFRVSVVAHLVHDHAPYREVVAELVVIEEEEEV